MDTTKQPLTQNVKATLWAFEAVRKCRDPEDYRERGTEPSVYARTLIEMFDSIGAIREEVANTQMPGAAYRAVYRLPDGSVCAVFDSGVRIAANESEVLRDPDGRFSEVWDGEEAAGLVRSVEFSLNSMGYTGVAADEMDNLSDPFLQDEDLGSHPLNDLGTLVAIDKNRTAAYLMNENNQLFAVPATGASARDAINTAIGNAHAMAADMRIPVAEILDEIKPGIQLYEEVERAFKQRPSGPAPSPNDGPKMG